MAVTVVGNKITMTAAADEVAMPLVVKTLRWIGATTATHTLRVHESSLGTTTKEIYRAEAGGASNTEESLKELHFPNGLRIDVIDSGQFDFYFQ